MSGLIDMLRTKLMDEFRGRETLTEEQANELREAAEVDEDISAALASIEVVADYLFLCQDGNHECLLNESSWLLKKLGRSIEEMLALRDDCELFLSKKAPKPKGSIKRALQKVRDA